MPSRSDGERRVAAILAAAGEVIAAAGYDGATMTAIAGRAGASIGTVYQYFPDKAAVGFALRAAYHAEIVARWGPLMREEAGLGTAAMVDRLFAVLTAFFADRPAYLSLLGAPLGAKRDPAARHDLRGPFAALFRRRRPSLTPAEAYRVASVTLRVLRALNTLYAEARPADRREVIDESKRVVTAYLVARLDAPP